MNFLSSILDFLNPISSIIDELHTSEDEKLSAKQKLVAIQSGVIAKVIDFERSAIENQSKVITAEAQADSWLTRSWRPIAMLTFVSLIVLNWFGVGPQPLPEDLWTVIKIGLGGYIGGRSLEKVVPVVVASIKTRDET